MVDRYFILKNNEYLGILIKLLPCAITFVRVYVRACVCVYITFVPYIVNQFSVSVWEQHVAQVKESWVMGFSSICFFAFSKSR